MQMQPFTIGGREIPAVMPSGRDRVAIFRAYLKHRENPYENVRVALAALGLCWDPAGAPVPWAKRLSDFRGDFVAFGEHVGAAVDALDPNPNTAIMAGEMALVEIMVTIAPSKEAVEDAKDFSGGPPGSDGGSTTGSGTAATPSGGLN